MKDRMDMGAVVRQLRRHFLGHSVREGTVVIPEPVAVPAQGKDRFPGLAPRKARPA